MSAQPTRNLVIFGAGVVCGVIMCFLGSALVTICELQTCCFC